MRTYALGERMNCIRTTSPDQSPTTSGEMNIQKFNPLLECWAAFYSYILKTRVKTHTKISEALSQALVDCTYVSGACGNWLEPEIHLQAD